MSNIFLLFFDKFFASLEAHPPHFPMHVSVTHAPTFVLKAVIILIALVALALCAFFVPTMWMIFLGAPSRFLWAVYPALVGITASVVPFLAALSQGFLLLCYIDRNHAFSQDSANALRRITYAAIAMTVLLAAAMPLAWIVAELDDAPGLIPISAAFACLPLVVATFAAVLHTLVQSAIDLKHENDLTI